MIGTLISYQPQRYNHYAETITWELVKLMFYEKLSTPHLGTIDVSNNNSWHKKPTGVVDTKEAFMA